MNSVLQRATRWTSKLSLWRIFFTHFTQNEREDEEVRRWIWPTMKTRLDAPSGPCLFIGKGGGREGGSLPVLTAPLTSEPISWALQPGTGSPILPPDGLFSRRWVPRRHLLKEEKHSGIFSKARCLARQNWRTDNWIKKLLGAFVKLLWTRCWASERSANASLVKRWTQVCSLLW